MTRLVPVLLMAAVLCAGPRAGAQPSLAAPGPLILQIPPIEPAKSSPPALSPGPHAVTPVPPVAAPAPVLTPPPKVAAPDPQTPSIAAPVMPSQRSAGASPDPTAAASPSVEAQSSPPVAVPSSPLAAAPVLPSVAAPASPPLREFRGGRFSFSRVKDTLVRFDSRTGQVSVCSQGAGGWSCQAVPDDRATLESEIGRLLGENATLRQQLAARDRPPPGGVQQPASPPQPPAAVPQQAPDKPSDLNPEARLPSDAELDRAMNFISKAWRRMVEVMVELQRDVQRRN